MRLIHYLTEKDFDQVEIMNLIKKDCKPWNKKSNGYLAFRGMNGQPNFLKRKVRTDRRPKDSSLEIHNAFDNAAKKKFGWKPRSEGIFCIGIHEVAKYYGLPYSVWPIGAFKFIWCNEIDDFFNTYEDADPTDMVNVVEMYSNKNLEKAIRSGVEIMVKCKEYYAVSNYFLDLGSWAAEGFGKWDD